MMSRRSITWGVFALACAAQLAFASSGILRGEATLRRGTVYRFEAAPVDPVDPFRGRFVALHFRPVGVPVAGGATLEPGDTAYVELGVDSAGFGRLERAHASPPAGDYLALPVQRASGAGVTVQLPFERYYAEEERAIEIDRQRWESGGRLVLSVRVLDGNGVIEELEPGDTTAPLSAEDLERPDAGAPLPEGLVSALRAAVPAGRARACRERGCVLFEVDLAPATAREFVFAGPDGAMHYWVEGERGWLRAGTLRPRSGRSLPAHALLAQLRATGARAVDPPLADLRIGEQIFGVQQ